jgi:anti-sigma factor RsiW
MHNKAHPDTELLDRLRAGLLDDDAGTKNRLERHLATCPHCRGRLSAWEHLGRDVLGGWPVTQDALSATLRLVRRRAMTAGRQRPIVLRHPLLATAAMLLIAVSAGFWTLRHEFADTVSMTAQRGEEVPDLYEDLDFYLWMANQGDDTLHEQGNNGNS